MSTNRMRHEIDEPIVFHVGDDFGNGAGVGYRVAQPTAIATQVIREVISRKGGRSPIHKLPMERQ